MFERGVLFVCSVPVPPGKNLLADNNNNNFYIGCQV
jgi:hypothetical protein